jgi:hypothetical protein
MTQGGKRWMDEWLGLVNSIRHDQTSQPYM